MTATPHRTQKNVRLSDDALSALQQLMAQAPAGTSESALLSSLLVHEAERRSLEGRAMALYEEGKDRWADVLERLRTA